MSKQETSRKPLIIGIIAAVVILAALLGLLLTQCVSGGDATQSTPAQTVPYLGEAEDYDLYWNLDRALYDGKSEAGMSSRKPGSDGYFHVRFFIDGEIVELKVADRKTVNAIEVNDLMGLEFDKDGIVVGVISLDDMPLQQVGWKFYVQSIGGNLLKLNSAKTFNGMELLLEMLPETGLYDMTGVEGEVGKKIKPIATDRVIAIANLEGKLTHVYIYERSEYMQTMEAECRHCKQTVTWKMWNKLDKLPTADGHYQLQNDIQLKQQQAVEEDAKVCLDLNGFAVDGGDNARVYTLHHPGANLALMDTSEEQKGVLRGHSHSSPQGGVVWVRYGAFYLYSGTLDASDMTSVINGTAVQVPKESFFYMYGGTIIGGTSKFSYNAETKKYSNGQGGAVAVSGKFVMNDGLITGGKAQSAITAWNTDGTPKTYQRGMGGNIAVFSGGVFQMRGGKIQNGVATHSGGNIYLDGTAEMILDGGMITGGCVTGKGRNGGNVFMGSKATLEMNGGSINWGTSYNCGANLYFNGAVQMNGGYIGKGVIRTFGTGKVKPADNRTNVFQVGGKMTMYGGIIEGGYTITDTSATDKTTTTLILGGIPVISADETSAYEDLVLTNGGSGVKVIVGTLVKGSKIGVNATTGIFTTPTAEANKDKFYSTIEGADILYVDGCVALGRMSCVCGSKEHFGKCDGTELLWAPINSSTIPAVSGNYFLAKDITVTAQLAVVENGDVKVDLNGKTITGPKNNRVMTTFNPGAMLTITDTSEAKTGVVKSRGAGTAQGNVVWVRYGSFDFYGGTLDGSEYKLHTAWTAGKDEVFGTKDDTTSGRDGGSVCMGGSTTFNMYGGTIIGNTAEAFVAEKTITEGEGDEAVETAITRDMISPSGASLAVSSKAVFNMHAGTIRDGISGNTAGNIYVNSGTMNMYGGTVSGGKAGPVYDEAGEKIVTKGWGGNIDVANSGTLNLHDGLITGGVAGGNGGNIRIGHAKANFTMYGGVIEKGESLTDQGGNMFLSGTINLTGGHVKDGKAVNGGNIAVNSTKDVTLKGVTVTGGVANGNGGNIRMSTTSTQGDLIIAEGTVISGGQAQKSGGNISLESNNANKNNPIAKMIITGGTITDGRAGAYDENGLLALKQVNSKKKSEATQSKTVKIDGSNVAVEVIVTTTEIRTSSVVSQGWGGNINVGANTVLEISGGEVLNGKAMSGGNLYVGGVSDVLLSGGKISGGVAGCFADDGKPAKISYTVITEERLKKADEYVKPESFEKDEEAQFNTRLETQKKAEAYYEAPEAKTTTKQESICNGWGGNVYLYAGSKAEISGATVSNGKSGGNGGGIYVNGKDCTFTMTAGTLSGNTTVTDNGGNLWVGGNAVLQITGGTIENGAAAKNGGNLHTNANVTTLLDNVTISGGTVNGKADNKSANVNLMAGDITIGSVNIAGYVNIGSDVKLVGKPVIKGGQLNLTLNGNKLDVSKLDAGKDLAMVGISDSKLGIFSGKTDPSVAGYFFSDHQDKGVVFVDGHLALGLGKTHCLCGHTAGYTGEHLPGCDKNTQRFWQAWTSTTSLPVDSGNYYLISDLTLSGQTSLENDDTVTRDGADITIDLNGHTIQNKTGKNTRLYWIKANDTNVTITDSVGGGMIKNDSTYTQGGVVWMHGKNNSLTLITGIIDVSDYTSVYTGAAAFAVDGTNSTFTMYGGTIYAPGAKTGEDTYGTGFGYAINVNGSSTMYLKGGHIEGGLNIHRQYSVKSEDENGDITYNVGGGNGGAMNIAGRLEMSGGTISGGRAGYGEAVSKVTEDGKETWSKAGGSGGNIYLTGTMIMTGGTISGGQGGALIEQDGKQVFAPHTISVNDAGKQTTTKRGSGGNISVSDKGVLEISGTAQILDGISGGNGGNIYTGADSVFKMSGGLVTGGETKYDQGGNLFLSSKSELTGGEVTLGKAANGGNIGINTSKEVLLQGVKILNGEARGDGGNIRTFSTNEKLKLIVAEGTVISGGRAAVSGGNISMDAYQSEDAAHLVITGGTITDGRAGKFDENGKLAFVEKEAAKKTNTTETRTIKIDGVSVKVDVIVTTTETRHFALSGTGSGGNINMAVDTTLEMTGGKVEKGEAASGGNIYFGGACDVKLQGGEITGGRVGFYDAEDKLVTWTYDVCVEERLKKAEDYKEGEADDEKLALQKKAEEVYEAPGAKLSQKAENASTGWGGNMYLYDGAKVELSGATVSGGRSGGNGGGIYIRGKDCTLTMTSGTLSGNTTTNDNGGNLWAGSGAVLQIIGGTIENGAAAKNGGNIHTNANVATLLDNVTISGGTVNGKADNKSANVNLMAGDITIGSANIAGYVNVASGSTIKLVGKPVITGGVTNLMLNGNDLDVTELDVGTDTFKIGISDTTAGIFTGTAQKGEENYFYSDDSSKVVGFHNGKLSLEEGNISLGRYTCSCAKPQGICVGTEGGCDGQVHFWTAWTETGSIPNAHGYWYLTKDVKFSAQFNMEKDAEIHIDLNGHVVTDTGGRTISTAAANKTGNVELWITDSSVNGTGTIKLAYATDKETGKLVAYDGQGGILWVASNSNVNLIAGTLDARQSANKNAMGGGAVHVSSGATFTMYGGTIYGAENANVGAAISVIDNSRFIMKGGIINGGKATTGGSVYLKGKNAVATVEAGAIAGGEASEGGNICVDIDGRVELLGGIVSDGKAIRYDKTGGNGGNIYVLGDLTINGATVSGGKAGTLDADGTTVLFTSAGWGGNICLGRMEVENKDKTKTVYTGSAEFISGTIAGGQSKGNGGSIYMNAGTEMTMSGGIVKNGVSHADQGGNIFCSGTLTITGGEIIDGIARNGGNIAINTPNTVSITGCTISGGQAGVAKYNENRQEGDPEFIVSNRNGSGGNIRINSSNTSCTLFIGDGTQIKDGSALNGGNLSINRVGVGKTGIVNLQGGTISDGRATSGGNIYVGAEAQLNVSGGTISGGTAANGGNIFVAQEQDKNDKTLYYHGSMTMSGGTVTGGHVENSGQSTGYGGNIWAAADISITGGTISNGTAGAAATADKAAVSGWGGNIIITGGKQLTVGGDATISGGWANNNGGSIHIVNGKMLMEGGTVSGGFTQDRGGNIFVAGNQTLTVTGGTITGGTAGGTITNGVSQNNKGGGNISTNGGAIVSLSNVSISDPHVDDRQLRSANMEIKENVKLTIGDGTVIDGGVGLVSSGITLNVSGKVIIDGGDACTSNLSLNGNTITLGELKADSSIGITNRAEGAFTKTTTEANTAYFFADKEEQGVGFVAVDNCLWLGHYDCQCAGAGKDGACVGAAGGCSESKLLWMPWNSTNSLPKIAGNWYLTNKVTLSTQVSNFAGAATINLDLNGNNIETSANRGIWLNKAIILTITDSVGGGTFKNTANHDQGSIFWIAAAGAHVRLINGIMDATGFRNRGTNSFGGTAVAVASSTGKFTMYGGELKANADATENIASAGAAVAVSASGGTFELHGGKIYGGKVMYQPYASSSSSGLYGGLGGAVFITNGGNMTMTGGEIIGGTAIAATATHPTDTTDIKTDGGLGGALYLAGTLNMSGGTISGGSVVSTLDSASNTVGGKGDNVYVASTGTLNISGGEIIGGVDASEAASVQVSGTAKIDRGDATNTTYSLNLGSKELTVGALAAGASIRITADEGAITGAGRTEADLAYFAADSADQAISHYSGKLYLGKYACICGSTTDVHKNYNDNGVLVGCDGTKVAWIPLTTTATTLPTTSGYFYLRNNMVLSGQASLAANSNVVLDLNGYKVTPAQKDGKDTSMRMISIHNNGAKLTLTDTYIVPDVSSADYDANRTGGEIITSANKFDTGNGVWVRGDKNFADGNVFVMLGGKITGADAVNTGKGTAVSVGVTGKFYMLGGTITGGKTTANGGNVYLAANSSMVMTGGTITEGNAGNGGNIYADKNASLTVSGAATISLGNATGNGGNIYLGEKVNMTLEGATITRGNAKNGGNITIDTGATLTMESGSITSGTATNGQNVQVFGNLVVNGGKIEGLTHVINWNVLSGASVTLSDDADVEQITLTKGTNLDDMDVNTIALPVITIEGTLATTVTENGVERTLDPILVNTYLNQDAYISGATVAANAARFTTSYEGRGVHFIEGENKLYVGKYSCLCGANCGGTTPGCDGEVVFWTAWDSKSDSGKLPSTTGNYYLTESFTVSTQTKPVAGAQIRLDLNGHIITRNDYRLYALNNKADANGNNIALFITDNSAAGTGTLKSTLKDTAGYTGQGTVLWIENGNDVTLLKGKLDASGMVTSGRGAAVTSDSSGSFFKMYGGTVIGGTAAYGGAIASLYGNVEIHGGSVTGDVEVRGNLTIDEAAGEVTMGDVLVKSWSTTVGSLILSGSPAITSIDLATGSADLAMPTITIGTLTNTAPYAINVAGDGYFTTETVEANAAKFAATEGKGVFFDQKSSKLFIGMEHCLCGGNGNTDTANGGTCVGATEGCDSIVRVWKPTASRPATTGNYYLTGDITIKSTAGTFSEVGTLAIDLNGYDIITNLADGSSGRIYSTYNVAADKEINFIFTNTASEEAAFVIDDRNRPTDSGSDQGSVVWAVGGKTTVTAYNVNVNLSNARYDKDATYPGAAFAVGKNGLLKLYGVEITGGTAINAAVVAVGSDGKALLHDTVITGNKMGLHYNTGNASSQITLSGTTYISGNTEKDIWLNSNCKAILLADGYTGTAGQISGITTDKVGDVVAAANGALTYGHKALFKSGNAQVLGFADGKLQMFAAGSHVTCVCGYKEGKHITFTDAAGKTVGCDGNEYVWTALTKLENLETAEGGRFYLTKNWETTIQIDLQTDAVNYLDLNGYTIKDTSGRLFSTNGATNTVFTVTDTYAGATSTDRPGGAISSDLGDTKREDYGTGFWLKGAGDTVNWFNATLDMSKVVMTKQGGCAFYSDAGTFVNIFSGDIIGGTAQKHSSNNSNAQGGTIRSSGTINLFGGTIRDGKTEQNGGNIHMMLNGVLNVYGGEIKGGSVGKLGGTFNANDQRSNVVLQHASQLNMYGGTIDGRVYGFNNPTGTVRFSKDAVLRAAVNTETSNNFAVGKNPIIVSELSEKALVYLTSAAASFTVTMEGTPMTLEQVNARLIAPGYTTSISGNIITFTKNP